MSALASEINGAPGSTTSVLPVLHFSPQVSCHRRSNPLKNEEAADEFRLPKSELPVAQSGQQASSLNEFERGILFPVCSPAARAAGSRDALCLLGAEALQ